MRSVKALILLTATMRLMHAVTIEQYHPHDFTLSGQASGNPFDVEVRGEFSGPDGTRITVPGFYAGGNIWKIRFSPTKPGRWSMITVSPLAALNAHTETDIQCTGNSNPAIHGGLFVDPVNRHHFIYEDGSRYFLMGYEADWLWGADLKDPERRVMRHLIDQIAARGFNHLLVNVYAYDTSWSKGHQNQWDYGPTDIYLFGGTNDKPDHARLNTSFFDIYDVMMNALLEKGIVANVMIKVYNKMVNWPQPGSKDEERYFRYVTARYQAYPNIIWDFSKEAYNERDKSLEKRLIDLVRANDGYHRLTTAHDNDLYDWDPKLNTNLDFRTDQEHFYWKEMALFDRQILPWPIVNSELYYERGVDDLPTYPIKQDWQEMIRGAYEVYLSGGYFVYYYSNTAWDVVKPDPEPPGMLRFQTLKENLAALPYWLMEPKPELAAGGPCLAIPGEVYAYLVQPSRRPEGSPPPPPTASRPPVVNSERPRLGQSREIAVNLNALQGPATVQWVNIWSGEKSESAIAGPGVYQFNRPPSFGAAPGLLIVRARH
jgi:Protein of unknown function (DUF4038)/Domain of unknown function (DUF5060)